jgi:HlyD family secretion protein
MKKFFLVLILLGAFGVGFLYRQGYFLPQDSEKELRLFGNVEIRQVLLGFRVPGRLDVIHYEEGQKVTSGDLLGALDPLPYEIKLAEARAALHQARANLEKMESGYRSGEIRQAAAQRDQIRASLGLAEKDYERLSNLFSQGAISKKDLDDITTNRSRLRAELSSAESALALVRDGYRTEDVKAAEAMVELAEAQMRETDNSLSDTRLYAPAEGTVLTRVAEPGTILAAGQAVYAVMLKNPVQVRTYVTEPRLGAIHLGMKGKIYTDSHPDPLEGVVNFIASDAEFTPRYVQTEDQRSDLVYRIRLLVEDNPQDRLKNGMPVTVILE